MKKGKGKERGGGALSMLEKRFVSPWEGHDRASSRSCL